jgi:hypothetical protein
MSHTYPFVYNASLRIKHLRPNANNLKRPKDSICIEKDSMLYNSQKHKKERFMNQSPYYTWIMVG